MNVLFSDWLKKIVSDRATAVSASEATALRCYTNVIIIIINMKL